MKCMKCGGENHPDQKVCVHCGALTPAGGGFYYEDKKWRPSKNMIVGAGAGLAVLLLVLILIKVLHVAPPEVVASEWMDAMSHRKVRTASKYITPAVEEQLNSRMMDTRALADEFYTEVNNEQSTYQFSKPVFDSPEKPKRADIEIKMKRPDGGGRTCKLNLIKSGRQWRINSIFY